jgi:hypothetical protein
MSSARDVTPRADEQLAGDVPVRHALRTSRATLSSCARQVASGSTRRGAARSPRRHAARPARSESGAARARVESRLEDRTGGPCAWRQANLWCGSPRWRSYCSPFGIDRTLDGADGGRVIRESQGQAAVDAFLDAVHQVGMTVEVNDAGRTPAGTDVTLINPAGGRLAVALKSMSLLSANGLARRLNEWDEERYSSDAIGVVVGDRITQEARQILDQAGWGWLDLRGHLRLVAQGVFVDTDLPSMGTRPRRSSPLVGKVGLDVAVNLLLEPEKPATVRRLAAEIGRAPSSVSEVLQSMQNARLLDDERRPVTPELFWEVAGRWKPEQAELDSVPSPGTASVNSALRLGLEDVENSVGWALSDTLAAAAYGAPVATRADHPPDFYVPNAAIQRRALQYLGRAPDQSNRAATIRVAPVPTVSSHRVDATAWANQEWPLAHPLFVALDLSMDPGRGREILEGWTPPERWKRVW